MPQESITIYIVDDDESIRKALKRLLKAAGYHALTFASAEDFLDSTSGRGEGCLVLDIRLPGITGLDLQEKLTLMGAKKAGAVAYLKKPFNEHLLLDAVRLGCDGRET
jgi:FixJ family two-component response regulator